MDSSGAQSPTGVAGGRHQTALLEKSNIEHRTSKLNVEVRRVGRIDFSHLSSLRCSMLGVRCSMFKSCYRARMVLKGTTISNIPRSAYHITQYCSPEGGGEMWGC